ncbi:MAG: DUF4982 domain-containing protein [Muribaculaceae bacterium]|nr:DUF4982 domain-containing protein [Muribaculaceae bacterium]
MKKAFITATAVAALGLAAVYAAPRNKYNFNSRWLLSVGDTPQAAAPDFDDSRWQSVSVPRAFNEDEAFLKEIHSHSDTVMWYRKHFRVDDLGARKVFVEFEGVRQAADVYINGVPLGTHENGAMAFGFDLTPYMREGDNVLALRVDNDWDYRERSTGTKFQWNNNNFNANYGGITKNVWLHVTDDAYQTLPLYSNLGTTGVYVYATDFDVPARRATVNAESEVRNDGSAPRILGYRVTVKDNDGKVRATFSGDPVTVAPGATATLKASAPMDSLNFWSWGYGYLYNVDTELIDEEGMPFDRVSTRTGFRKTDFGEGKVWLNDRVMQMHGYAQRTSNEWPAVGVDIPAWLSDYSNGMIVEGNGNLVRWMHITPSKQDVESCDRVGLLQAMPAGDAEKDREGRQWEQRTELMRDAIIYNRNNPSVIFYESGNESISRDHMIEMKTIRDLYDPHGGRAIGSREMLDIDEAEYGGEMLYINKSHKHPMWATEYCRDEGLRKYWDEYSYPYHKEGDGPLYRDKPAGEYNHNQDEMAKEWVRRWYDYFRERPGTGTRVSSGGVKIVFSDTNTHNRSAQNYRNSGATDPMRIPKDGYFVHRAMWNGWVDPENPEVYIIGHWNYADTVVKSVYVVSNCEDVCLSLNGRPLDKHSRDYHFLHTFDDVAFEAGELTAVGLDADGKEVCSYSVQTVGVPAALRLTPIVNPAGFHAAGAELALVEVEVVDSEGRRCPLDNRDVRFSITGEGEWRGGIAQGPDNCILSTTLPVECGVNRALIRSTTSPGIITLVANADGLPESTITFNTVEVPVSGGLSEYVPGELLGSRLDRGPAPSTPSYTDTRRGVAVAGVRARANDDKARLSIDDNELSEWTNDGNLSTAWITYRLERPAVVKDVCLKLTGWRNKSYPIEILAGDEVVWSGDTPKSLGYVHLPVTKDVLTDAITIRLRGASTDDSGDISGITELAGGRASELDNATSAPGTLRIVEAEFLEDL